MTCNIDPEVFDLAVLLIQTPISGGERDNDVAHDESSLSSSRPDDALVPVGDPPSLSHSDNQDGQESTSSVATRSTLSRQFSTTLSSLKNNQSDVSLTLSNKRQTFNTVQAFEAKKITKVQFGEKIIYQATAISSTCETIALIKRSEFQIFSIGKPESGGGMTAMKSRGFNDGRYKMSVWSTTKSIDVPTAQKISPTYIRAAMSDTVLCIACAENCIEVHETSTSKRIGTIEIQNRRCCTLTMSSNGLRLAAGMETGEILLYNIGDERNFVTVPTLIESCDGSRSVNCIAFSPDSGFLSYCSSANSIRTCSLDENGFCEVSKYNRRLDAKSLRKPYYGVTCLA